MAKNEIEMLKKEVARLTRQLEHAKWFLCADVRCKKRRTADICPYCGSVINIDEE